MGAITKRHQGIRHLRLDITHIKLSLNYDHQCKDYITEYVTTLPEPMRFNYNLLMTKKDLKDVLLTYEHISLANDVITTILRQLNKYRHQYPLPPCQSCRQDICHCSKRYLINDFMTH